MTETEEIELETIHVKKETEKRSYSRWIVLFLAVVAATGAAAWWIQSESYESTERRAD